MTWLNYHLQSEKFANLAEEAARKHDFAKSVDFYGTAAKYEEEAFESLDETKVRTKGITAVSAVSLWFNSREFQKAKFLAYKYLGSGSMPPFAIDQLEELLQAIQGEEAIIKSGIQVSSDIGS